VNPVLIFSFLVTLFMVDCVQLGNQKGARPHLAAGALNPMGRKRELRPHNAGSGNQQTQPGRVWLSRDCAPRATVPAAAQLTV